MKQVIIIVVGFLLAIVTANVLTALAVIIFWGMDAMAEGAPSMMFGLYVCSFTLTAVLLWLFKRTLKLEIPSFKPQIHRLNLPLIVGGVVAMFAIGILLSPLLNLMPDSNLDPLYDMMSGGVWAIMTGVVAAPILEEYLCRGILQSSLIKHSSPVVGIVIASLIFGAIHMIPQQMISAFFMALVLGSIFYLTRSLVTVVFIHMLNNGLAYIQMIYFGTDSNLEDLLFPSKSSFAVAYVVCAVLIVTLGYLTFRSLRRSI